MIFVLNTLGRDLAVPLDPEERVSELCNVQSIGAALENMTLAALAVGYAAENPPPRPRKGLEAAVEWRC